MLAGTLVNMEEAETWKYLMLVGNGYLEHGNNG